MQRHICLIYLNVYKGSLSLSEGHLPWPEDPDFSLILTSEGDILTSEGGILISWDGILKSEGGVMPSEGGTMHSECGIMTALRMEAVAGAFGACKSLSFEGGISIGRGLPPPKPLPWIRACGSALCRGDRGSRPPP